MSYTDKLYGGHYYHVYNRGNNGENLFIDPDNYFYFLRLYVKYICSIADTFAYCLMKNHFHFLIKVMEDVQSKSISRAFSNLFNAYAKAFNKYSNRHGSLFERPFKRKLINSQAGLIQVVCYIHSNPVKHGFVRQPTQYEYSSYRAYQFSQATFVKKKECLDWFSGLGGFINYHQSMNYYSFDDEKEFV